mmetsp:Transcript_107700/g.313475  ORF Transcript_107700/g.313475 Transcript_107700/m.313475 type:complete len:238 (-) Transcript_107700:881-1594(-)
MAAAKAKDMRKERNREMRGERKQRRFRGCCRTVTRLPNPTKKTRRSVGTMIATTTAEIGTVTATARPATTIAMTARPTIGTVATMTDPHATATAVTTTDRRATATATTIETTVTEITIVVTMIVRGTTTDVMNGNTTETATSENVTTSASANVTITSEHRASTPAVLIRETAALVAMVTMAEVGARSAATGFRGRNRGQGSVFLPRRYGRRGRDGTHQAPRERGGRTRRAAAVVECG